MLFADIYILHISFSCRSLCFSLAAAVAVAAAVTIASVSEISSMT